MQKVNRQIIESKSFINALNKYFNYKSGNYEDAIHARKKYNQILMQIIIKAGIKKYPHKKIVYKNSKNLQYFVFEQHLILFELTNDKMSLKYFVAAKRIKKDIL